METIAEIKIPKRRLSALYNDGIKTAAAINLVYVKDIEPGIKRIYKETGFTYVLKRKAGKGCENIGQNKKPCTTPGMATGVDMCKRKTRPPAGDRTGRKEQEAV